jgi:hypothetical protein
LDWVPSPSIASKKSHCGKITQITFYTTGSVNIKGFYCHRYDCPRCSADHKNEIKAMIVAKRKMWYFKVIDEDELSKVQEKVFHTDVKYCALGTGANILLLTTSPVLSGTRFAAVAQLAGFIDKALDCGYQYRTRRFRHSQGLFPAKAKSTSNVHIASRYASVESPEAVVRRFTNEGYEETSRGQEHYLRPAYGVKRTREEIMAAGAENLIWAEA